MERTTFTKESSFVTKGVAILAMIFLHAFQDAEVNAAYVVQSLAFSEQNLQKMACLGQICVGVFVFLTAYGIIKQCKKDDSHLGMDTVKRFLYLMSDFFFMFLFCNVLFGYFINYGVVYEPRKRAIFYILIDSLGLANMLETPMMNSTWWYMELAYVLIIILPICYLVLKKFGAVFGLLGGLVLPFVFGTLNFELDRWLILVVLGACAAYGDWFESILCFDGKKWQKAIKVIGCIAAFFVLAYMRGHSPYNNGRLLYYIDGIWSLTIVVLCFNVVQRIPGLNQKLVFLGKHSKNIFFVHAFFIMLFEERIYSLRYAGLIYLCILVLSLLVSMLLDFVKKQVRYQKLVDVFIMKLVRI